MLSPQATATAATATPQAAGDINNTNTNIGTNANSSSNSSAAAGGGAQPPLQQQQQQQQAVRHWSYDGALLDFRLARYQGAPGDIDVLVAAAGGCGIGVCTRDSGFKKMCCVVSDIVWRLLEGHLCYSHSRLSSWPLRIDTNNTTACAGLHSGAAAASAASNTNNTTSSSTTSGHEDLPGVPAEAWVRVSRGLLPSEPYTQGECGC